MKRRHLMRAAAAAMSRATAAALGDAHARTGDIRGNGNTATFTQAVLRNLTL